MDQGNVNTSKGLWITLWIISLVMVGIAGYIFGVSKPSESSKSITSLATTPTAAIESIQLAQEITPAPSADLEQICEITGPSQKKDYLDSYTLKEGDSINSIAEKELGDVSRNSEITLLNEDAKQLMVGSVIYLPPKELPPTSGRLFQTSGRIVKKDKVSWQLSYGGGVNGTGIVFPAFWFEKVSNVHEFSIGDCVTIFFDNGVKVFTITKN